VHPRQDRRCSDRSRGGGDDAGVGPSPVGAGVDPSGPAAAVHHRVASLPPHRADHRGAHPPGRDSGRGRQPGAALDHATAPPWRPHACVPGEVRGSPRHTPALADPVALPRHAPGGGGLLPQDLAAGGEGVRASPRGPTPGGVLIPRRLGLGRQRLASDRWSGPVGQGRERPRALGAVWRRESDPWQGRRPSAPPAAEARAAHAWTTRARSRVTWRQAPAGPAWTSRRGRRPCTGPARASGCPRFARGPAGVRTPLETGGPATGVGPPFTAPAPGPRPGLGREPLRRCRSARATIRHATAALPCS